MFKQSLGKDLSLFISIRVLGVLFGEAFTKVGVALRWIKTSKQKQKESAYV